MKWDWNFWITEFKLKINQRNYEYGEPSFEGKKEPFQWMVIPNISFSKWINSSGKQWFNLKKFEQGEMRKYKLINHT